MTTLKVAFLWHMHQPSYKDSASNTYLLPWVRLHCIKEYYDMISLAKQFPHVKQTFNMVPSLVEQILDYCDDDVSDLFLACSRKKASDLSREERVFILKNFFMCNRETMVKPFPRYWNLLRKRGMDSLNDQELSDADHLFTVQDYLDIQVWFNLTWFGFSALQTIPELIGFIKKGRYFSEGDKQFILDSQFTIIKKIIPAYKKAMQDGLVELTTSPYYHPILPLVYDTDFARRCMPHAQLPERMSFPEDVENQIKKAVEFHEKVFGERPVGLWPSEGSVAPELIPALSRNGIEWIATDEDILLNSLPENNKGDLLYQPYSTSFQGEKINIVFRDRGLSDLIGFTYSKNPPEHSVNDLLNHLFSIKNYVVSQGQDPTVFIILDGENPWEHFPDGGEGFLKRLYERLTTDEWIEPIMIKELFTANTPLRQIDNLYTGSWISHNFKVWIGHHEDNRGWEYIRQTRKFLENFLKNNTSLSPDIVKQAWEEIYIAQGSDWFWWYGDDFSSDNDLEFDRLFRSHLEKVYTLLKKPIPEALKIPIKEVQEKAIISLPTAFISPTIDGKQTDFFEWFGAGRYHLKEAGSTMHQGKRYFSSLYFGFDAKTLYLRIDPFRDEESFFQDGFSISVNLFHESEYKASFPCLSTNLADQYFELYQTSSSKNGPKPDQFSTIAIKDIIELSIPFDAINLQEKTELKFMFQLMKDEIELERYPKERLISFHAPDKHFNEMMWSAI